MRNWKAGLLTGAPVAGIVAKVAAVVGVVHATRAAPHRRHSVVGLVRALANEWAPHGLTVNFIAPRYIETAATEVLRAHEAWSRDILTRIPARGWRKPEDIAGAAVFLVSSASSYVNEHVLAVDGGRLAR